MQSHRCKPVALYCDLQNRFRLSLIRKVLIKSSLRIVIDVYLRTRFELTSNYLLAYKRTSVILIMKASTHIYFALLCLVLVTFFSAKTTPVHAVANTSSTGVSVAEIIELFIALEIIPSDKAEQARSILKERVGDESAPALVRCVTLTQNLYMGVSDAATGGEVTKLQAFLKETGDFTYPKVTGYYGPATETAVQRWQARMQIVTSGSPETNGYGVVGPMTRARMVCSAQQKEQFKQHEVQTEKKVTEEVKKETQKETEVSTVTSITLSGHEGGKVTWVTRGTSPSGYKVVWSRSQSPTYPTRSSDRYQYFSDPKVDSTTLKAFDGAGRYFVRVCEYANGKCGVYSNEIVLEL